MVIDPLGGYPGYALRRASAASLNKLAKKLAALDLRPAEATVLTVIEANPGITQSEIGRLLDIASANMAPLAARLEDRNLIERKQVNGRSHGLHLSVEGRRQTMRARKAMHAHEQVLLSRIPERHRSIFLSCLQKLQDDSSAAAEE